MRVPPPMSLRAAAILPPAHAHPVRGTGNNGTRQHRYGVQFPERPWCGLWHGVVVSAAGMGCRCSRHRSVCQASQARSSCGVDEAGSRRRLQKAQNSQVRLGQPSVVRPRAGPHRGGGQVPDPLGPGKLVQVGGDEDRPPCRGACGFLWGSQESPERPYGQPAAIGYVGPAVRGTPCRSRRLRCQALRKASRSALMTSACVVGMPCGKPV
jgi:hypothetical protein